MMSIRSSMMTSMLHSQQGLFRVQRIGKGLCFIVQSTSLKLNIGETHKLMVDSMCVKQSVTCNMYILHIKIYFLHSVICNTSQL